LHQSFKLKLFFYEITSQTAHRRAKRHSERTCQDRGCSKLRTHIAIEPYGRSMPRSIAPSYGRCVSSMSSSPCRVQRFGLEGWGEGPPKWVSWSVTYRETQGVPEHQKLPVHTGDFILHHVCLRSFCRIQLPHKSVNLLFTITNMKNKLTDLCGNGLFQNDLKSTLSEMRLAHRATHLTSGFRVQGVEFQISG